MGIKRAIKRNVSETPSITISEAYRQFEYEKRVKGCVDKTLANYSQSLWYLIEHMGAEESSLPKQEGETHSDLVKRNTSPLNAISRDTILEWTNAMLEANKSVKTINHYLTDCRAFLYWCMHDDRQHLEPFTVELTTGQEPKTKIYTPEEIKRVLAKPKRKNDADFVEWRNWTIANLVYDMGARVGSVLEIRMEDINLTKHTIYLSHMKNKATKNAKISTSCTKVLKEFIQDWRADAEPQEYLFCSFSAEQLTYNAFAHSFSKYCKDRGINKTSIHGIRHTFATNLANNTNGNVAQVQKALGHSTIDMAQKYIDLSAVDMGNYDDISPLERTRTKRGKQTRKITKSK